MPIRAHSPSLQIPLALLVFVSQTGCSLIGKLPSGKHDTKASYHDHVGLKIEYPQVAECATATSETARNTTAPLTLEDPSQLPALELSLEEAIQMAVGQSPVLRSVGGTIVQAPQTTTSVYDPALAHANPLGGVEAALAAFDAQYSGEIFWAKTDRPTNNRAVFAFQQPVSQGTGASFRSELSKQTAQGARFALRSIVDYDRNDIDTLNQFRAFRSAFDGFLEAEWRQPLMQGSGTLFNQIAGPNSAVGQYNGVLIARVNEDVALADFEAAVVELVDDVEEAYWNLHLRYRLLEANLRGRESALQTFQYQEVRLRVGTGRQDEDAQARSQFFQFQAQVENGLAGETGLYAAEQRLRYLLGLPAADGRLIKPTTEPSNAEIVFDWDRALGQALTRRVEIRRQQWNVKRRELELTAARLNRRPRLDFVGQYRTRGLGDHLIGDSDPSDPRDNLYSSITGGNFNEWQAGMELTFPVGLRTASTAIAHARLNVARERALLDETELRVSHDLSTAARELRRAHVLLETNYNRWQADIRQLDVLRQRYRDGLDPINFFLQAQQQVVISESDFYRSLIEYNLAIRDLHRQKGTLLAYNQVQLAEGPSVSKAYESAYETGRFFTPRRHPEKVSAPQPISRGSFDPTAPGETNPPMESPENVPAPEPSATEAFAPVSVPAIDIRSPTREMPAIPVVAGETANGAAPAASPPR
jgi:outer membrane protein TolC